jgi:probable HAF family extracellular repeat protein
MSTRSGRWILAIGIALAGDFASAAPGFQGLGDLSGGDFDSRALAISGDGSVVVGWSMSASGLEAFRWTAGEGMVGLGDLAGGPFHSMARGVNWDGTVIVGRATIGTNAREAFRWTQDTGMVSIGDLPGGLTQADAIDVSDDGSVIVGTGTRSPTGGVEPFRWTPATGIQLLVLPGGAASGSARAVSADGNIVVGTVSFATGSGIQGYRWTESTGIELLGDVPGHPQPPQSSINAISADGSTLAGLGWNSSAVWTASVGFQLIDPPDTGSQAFAVDGGGYKVVGTTPAGVAIWEEGIGPRLLADVLADAEVDLTGWELLLPTGISDDGLTITGVGTNPSGQYEGWIATLPGPLPLQRLPEPATAWLFGAGAIALSVLRFTNKGQVHQ